MKRSELNKIIKEEIGRHLVIEGIIDSLISLFISPKIRKDVKNLKGSPKWKELEQKLSAIKDDMQNYNDQLEAYIKKCEADSKWFKSRGKTPPVDCFGLTKYKHKI